MKAVSAFTVVDTVSDMPTSWQRQFFQKLLCLLCADVWPDLPQMLSCSWQAGVPTLTPLPYTDHAGLQAAAQAFTAGQSFLHKPVSATHGKPHTTPAADDMGEKISRAAMMPGMPKKEGVGQVGGVAGDQPGPGFNSRVSRQRTSLAGFSQAAAKAGRGFDSRSAALAVSQAHMEKPEKQAAEIKTAASATHEAQVVQKSQGQVLEPEAGKAAIRETQRVGSAAVQQWQRQAAIAATVGIENGQTRLHAEHWQVHQQQRQQRPLEQQQEQQHQHQQQEKAVTAEDSALLVFEDRWVLHC